MTLVTNNRIALYVRVSSEDQVKGFSIDAQLEALRTYAREHQLSIYKEYIDAGYSGKTIEGRQAMKELLEDAKQGDFQHVASWKINRMGRNLIDLLTIIDVFKQHEINYVSLTEQFHSDTAQGNLVLQMLGAVAQLEREQIAQNTRLGVRERNKQGKWNSGNNVLGYEWVQGSTRNDSYVRVIPKEAELVRSIFEKYRNGMGLKAITNRLNAAGYHTKRNKPFSIMSIKGIITNVNYIGKISYTAKNEQGHVITKIVDSHHEPIIEISLWEDVQQILQNRSKSPIKLVQRDYLLSGLLKCPMCGSGMIPAHVTATRKNGSSKTNFYYVCGNWNNKGSSVCKRNAVPASAIEEQVIRQLEALLTTEGMLNKIVSRIRSRQVEANEPARKHLIEAEAMLKEIEKKLKRCFEMFEDGFLEQNETVTKISELQQTQNDLLADKQQIEAKKPKTSGKPISVTKIKRALTRLLQSLHKEEPTKRNALLRGFIHSIHISRSRKLAETNITGTKAIQNISF